jgi:hypothetical protein
MLSEFKIHSNTTMNMEAVDSGSSLAQALV